MQTPALSVILPVYNAGTWLKEAVDSILQQDFRDFELLLLDDGSTDGSGSILKQFQDPRIILLPNEKNMGLVKTLNRGISLARGRYIARMDADDISLPSRFREQVKWLDEHPATGMVATTIDFIDENGNKTGAWQLDRETTSHKKIKRILPWQNCLAHPTVMGRKELFQQFQYRQAQANIEDYDLWLRMMNAGVIIEKLATPLLLYRVHGSSITKKELQTRNFYFFHFRTKWRFIKAEGTKAINAFALKTALVSLIDLAHGLGKAGRRFFHKNK